MKFGKYRVVKHQETKTEGVIASKHRYDLFEILSKDQEKSGQERRKIAVTSESAIDELILYGDCEIELKQPQQKLGKK